MARMKFWGVVGVSLAVAGLVQPSLATETALTVSVKAPLSEDAARMRDALALRPDFEAISGVYQLHDYMPIWSPFKAAALKGALEAVERHGLPAARYDTGVFETGTVDSLGAEELDIRLTELFLQYARDINSGLLEPRSVDRDIVIKPKRPDPSALLEGMAETPDPVGYLQALAPTHRHYVDLLDEKARLEGLIAAGGWGAPVPAGSTIKLGAEGPRIAALRARLGRIMDIELEGVATYDEPLQEVVKTFQLRHGLNDDGVIGPKTLEALNASPEDRLRQVLVNLERQRWLNYDRGSRHVYVNQADYRVHVIDHGEAIYTSRVVIGKNKHRTQEFNDQMTHLVVNPTWHVPRSIATEEMLPKLKASAGALGDSMQIMTRNGTRINPQLIDFSQFTKANFPFVMKQRPGQANALGRVKFMFPNEFNIYLHDTPAKSLFSRDTRAYSHGCVRVQKPFELAAVLLGAQSDDPEGDFRRYLDGGRERRVNLDQPVPVYLTYQSAWIETDGAPQYREDIYGRDARVFEALAASGVTLGAVDG